MSLIYQSGDPSIKRYFDALLRNLEYFVNSAWLDSSGAVTKEDTFENEITFKVETKDIPDGTTLEFKLFDKDALFDDDLNQVFSANVNGDSVEFKFVLDYKWLKDGGEEPDREIEIYFKVSGEINGEDVKVDLPKNPDDYLSIYNLEIAEHFVKTSWLDSSAVVITEQEFGNNVAFRVETKDIPDGTVLDFKLFDKDAFFDDNLNQVYTATVNSDLVEFNFTLDEKWLKDGGEEFDKAIEIYFEVTGILKGEEFEIDLPKEPEEYLTVYEEEVLISVIVELPHPAVKGLENRLGLAGHTAMAIGDQYYDYGPLNENITVDERDYGVDFNGDGDSNDIVTFGVDVKGASHHFSAGRSWWGAAIGQKHGISPKNVTLTQARNYIRLHWLGAPGPRGDYPNKTFIYGEVHLAEFYVRKSQAIKIEDWWKYRYDHLGIYSTLPWIGQQCTTTVKIALRDGGIRIPRDLLRPSAMLNTMRHGVRSTSHQHKEERAKVTLIKVVSHDFPPPGATP